MKMERKSTSGLPYARKEGYTYEENVYEADIQNGDVVELLSEGEIETGEYGDQFVFNITTRNGDRRANFNQRTRNALIDTFGDESSTWVGKKLTVFTKKDTVAGKKVIIAYFLPAGWRLDDYGEPVQMTQSEQSVAAQAPANTSTDQDDVRVEDIPF